MSKQFILVTKWNGDVVAVNVSKIIEIMDSGKNGRHAYIAMKSTRRRYYGFTVCESVLEVLRKIET